MKNFLVVFALVCQLSLTGLADLPFSQTAGQAQTKPTPATRQQSAPPSDEDVVRITTNLVQVDPVITDKNGKQVTDLRPDEVQILEDDKPQKITNFSYIALDSAELTPRPPAAKPAAGDPPPVPPAPLKPGQVRRTIALVVDDLGLSFESIYVVRRTLKKFIDQQLQPQDLVAIVRTGGGMGALQQFTSDKRQLYAAVEAVKWNSIGRAGVGSFAPLREIHWR